MHCRVAVAPIAFSEELFQLQNQVLGVIAMVRVRVRVRGEICNAPDPGIELGDGFFLRFEKALLDRLCPSSKRG